MSERPTPIPALRAAVARAVLHSDHSAEAVARRELAEAKIADYVEKALSAAPPLTDEQRTRLVELLRPARNSSRTSVVAERLAELGGGGAA